jgi:hypothetical protein
MAERIERQIELHESKVTYKNHTLWLRSYELKAGGWIPKAKESTNGFYNRTDRSTAGL